jgi:hypothetical protein
MVTVRHISRGAHAGCLINGTVPVLPPEGDQALSHLDRAYYLASALESPRYGTVQSYDGAAMSAGPFHFVAVLPKALQQGPLWPLLRRLELAQAPVEPLFQALRDGPGWFVARDGVLRHFDTGALIPGAAIRRELTPANGKVPKTGPEWLAARRWALLFHALMSAPASVQAQREHSIEWLAKDPSTFERRAYQQFAALLHTPVDPHGLRVGNEEGALPPALDLALCVYHAFSVNAPAVAQTRLKASVTTLERTRDPARFARELIRKLGTAQFGNWADRPGQASRYDRTRLVAERSGLWPRALLRSLMPEDFGSLPVA